MSKNIGTAPPPIVFILLAILGIFSWSKLQPLEFIDTKQVFPKAGFSSSLLQRFSFGEKMLIGANVTKAKRNGITAYQQQKYSQAAAYFQQSLAEYPNDPETSIYLQNSLIAERQTTKIAAVVPIGSNLDVAQEMLRGIAQAQQEFNQQGGKLQVQIIDDENDSDLARQIAKTVAQDNSILAVIGSNASNASLAGAEIYQQAQVVMITPTSTSEKLSYFGNYIFRSGATNQAMAEILADYVVHTAKRIHVGVCFASEAPDNVTFKDAFIPILEAKGGKHIDTQCDFSAPDFNGELAVNQLISHGAEAVLLAPHIDKLNRAIDLARANQWKMVLLGTFSLNTTKITRLGQGDLNGIVLPVPFHEQQASATDFTAQAQQLWGEDLVLTWRTATSYDATKAIAATLTPNARRQDLQRRLRNHDLIIAGANGTVKFLPSGDRSLEPTLVTVKANPQQGYYFELLKDR